MIITLIYCVCTAYYHVQCTLCHSILLYNGLSIHVLLCILPNTGSMNYAVVPCFAVSMYHANIFTSCTVPRYILYTVQVEWEEIEPEEDDASLRNPSVSQYFVKVGKPTRGKPSRIHPYFKERCLAPLTTL